MARLSTEPEFALRLQELVAWHGLAERPALVVQARPTSEFKRIVDLTDAGLRQRFQSGLPVQENWWDGFQSMVSPVQTFHGMAALPARYEPGWTTELHEDGHLIAAIWQFPDLPLQSNDKVAALPASYAQFFMQFFELVAALMGSSASPNRWSVSATLLHADRLSYANMTRGNRYGAAGGRSPLQHWQWPIAEAELGSEEWTSLGVRMGSRLRGIFKDE